MVTANYLGIFDTICLSQNTGCRSLEEKIVEQVENAQISKKLKSTEKNEVSLEFSRYGVKIICMTSKMVKLRIPLVELILMTSFLDGFGRIGVVLVEKKNSTSRYKSHLFRLSNDAEASVLCNLVKNAFSEAEEALSLIEPTEPPSPSVAWPKS